MMTEEQIRQNIEKRNDELREEFAKFAVNNEHNLRESEAFQEWTFSKLACLEVVQENSHERQMEVLIKLALLEKNIDAVIAECDKLTKCLTDIAGFMAKHQ